MQNAHLQKLAERPEQLIIPIKIFEGSPSQKPLFDCLPGRRLTEEERKGNVSGAEALTGRLFQGPEPSWIRKKREAQFDSSEIIPRRAC